LRIVTNSVENIQAQLKPDNNNGTSHEDLHLWSFMIISLWILRMRNVYNVSYRENQNIF